MGAEAKHVSWRSFARDIVVVMIGVLIALAVGDWASARADRRLEAQYLTRLARDLRADSVMLAQGQQAAASGESAAQRLLAVLIQGRDVPDSVVARDFSDATRGAYLAPNTPTIEELKSTGNLRVLHSDSLRDAILTYYAALVWLQRSLQTVMERGKDPLGELGWDIAAFDPLVAYSVNVANAAYLPRNQAGDTVAPDGLARRFRNHPDAERVTRRAITYNRMLEPIVAAWQNDLATVRHKMPR